VISINNLDVIVIGAGQAGLAMSYHLTKAGIHHLVLDAHAHVGDSWRSRYDSLVLFTPRSYSSLPGLKLEGNQEAYPTKDEIADYLMKFAETYSLPIQMKTKKESHHQRRRFHSGFCCDSNRPVSDSVHSGLFIETQ
jgi:putative flavoprotein involved in K+ transport